MNRVRARCPALSINPAVFGTASGSDAPQSAEVSTMMRSGPYLADHLDHALVAHLSARDRW